MLNTPEAKEIFKSCNRFLTHDYPKAPRQILSELVETIDPDLEADRYGQGELITSFEKEVAGLLGKEAAVFMPSGTMCQQIALRIWQRRHGGNLFHLYPYVLSAQKGLRERLGRMESYHAKAKEIAALLAPFSEITIVPNPPHTNMMHLFLQGERAKLEAATLEIARETGIWLFSWLASTQLPPFTMFELTVGEATLDLSKQEIVAAFQSLLTRASA